MLPSLINGEFNFYKTHPLQKVYSNKTKAIRTIFLVTVYLFFAGILLTSCFDTNRKILPANKTVIKINEADNRAIEENYQKDVANFKMLVNDKVALNAKRIAKLEAEKNISKMPNLKEYESKTKQLENANDALKNKINSYDNAIEDKSKWGIYKDNITSQMDELTRQIDILKLNNK